MAFVALRGAVSWVFNQTSGDFVVTWAKNS